MTRFQLIFPRVESPHTKSKRARSVSPLTIEIKTTQSIWSTCSTPCHLHLRSLTSRIQHYIYTYIYLLCLLRTDVSFSTFLGSPTIPTGSNESKRHHRNTFASAIAATQAYMRVSAAPATTYLCVLLFASNYVSFNVDPHDLARPNSQCSGGPLHRLLVLISCLNLTTQGSSSPIQWIDLISSLG